MTIDIDTELQRCKEYEKLGLPEMTLPDIMNLAIEQNKEITRLREALGEVASSKSMTTPFVMRSNYEGRELKARMIYAEQALQED